MDKKTLKVVQACEYLPDYGGNFMDSLRSIETAAERVGTPLEVIYILPEGRPDLDWIKELQRNHKVYFVTRKSTYATAKAICNVCRKEKADILHRHFYSSAVLILTGFLTRTKVLRHCHNTFSKSSSILKESVRRGMNLAIDKFVGCSEEAMNTLVDGGFPKGKCTFVTNRIDFSRLDVSTNLRPFDSSKNNLLILGSDFMRKGCDLALMAIEPIAKEYKIELQIVCHNEALARENVRRVLGYEPEWVKYPPTTQNIGDYYRNSKIFLSPSRKEGFCYGVVEAAYCNCAVVKSDIPAMVHDLEGEDFVRIPLTVDALREKIVEILTMSPEQSSEMLAGFREQVIRKFDVSIWGDEVLQLYNSVMK